MSAWPTGCSSWLGRTGWVGWWFLMLLTGGLPPSLHWLVGSEATLWARRPRSVAAACADLEQTAVFCRRAVSQLLGGGCVSTGTLAVLARGTVGWDRCVTGRKTTCHPTDCPVISLFQSQPRLFTKQAVPPPLSRSSEIVGLF